MYGLLPGVANARIFPWAFLASGANKHDFFREVLVEQIVRLIAGIHVRYRGTSNCAHFVVEQSQSVCVI